MKRVLAAIFAGLITFGAVYGLAASLNLTSDSLGAGTVVFYLHNIPAAGESPDHAMVIGATDVQFYPDGSVKSGQLLADSGDVVANEAATCTVKGLEPGTYIFWCNVQSGIAGTGRVPDLLEKL